MTGYYKKERALFVHSLAIKNHQICIFLAVLFFLITKKILFKNKSFTSNKMNFYEIKNTKENIDIDTYDDLNIAKKFA